MATDHPLIANLEDLKEALELLRDAGVTHADLHGIRLQFSVEPPRAEAVATPSTPSGPVDAATEEHGRPGYSQLFGRNIPSFVIPKD